MRLTFAALIGALLVCPAFAQEDLPMFEDASSGDCPTCRAAKKMPNVGKDAKNVDSIKFAPALPEVDVSMETNEETPDRPFSGQKMKYNSRYIDSPSTTSYSSNLTKPVDYSAKSGKEIKITTPKEKEDVKADASKEDKKIEGNNKKEKASASSKKKPPKAPEKMIPTKDNKNIQQQVMINQQNEKALHQAEKFDIADLRLGMQPEDVIETAQENGFELTNVAYGIPSFMVTDFERECRASGLYQTRLIHECMRETARKNEVYYISQLVFNRLDSKEQIIVLFSSALTDNKAFKIDYTAFGDNSLGTSYKDLLKKTNRRDIFWKYVFDKYGRPAQKEVLFWGSANGVYMKAFLQGNALDGRIVLEDVTQKGTDYGEAKETNGQKDVNSPFNF